MLHEFTRHVSIGIPTDNVDELFSMCSHVHEGINLLCILTGWRHTI